MFTTSNYTSTVIECVNAALFCHCTVDDSIDDTIEHSSTSTGINTAHREEKSRFAIGRTRTKDTNLDCGSSKQPSGAGDSRVPGASLYKVPCSYTKHYLVGDPNAFLTFSSII